MLKTDARAFSIILFSLFCFIKIKKKILKTENEKTNAN